MIDHWPIIWTSQYFRQTLGLCQKSHRSNVFSHPLFLAILWANYLIFRTCFGLAAFSFFLPISTSWTLNYFKCSMWQCRGWQMNNPHSHRVIFGSSWIDTLRSVHTNSTPLVEKCCNTHSRFWTAKETGISRSFPSYLEYLQRKLFWKRILIFD